MLIFAIALITAALILYTIGVWTERRAGTLHGRHAALFAGGLAFDASGTFVMNRIAGDPTIAATYAGPLSQVMVVTGALALVLMAAHLAWALAVLARGRASEKVTFHRFSTLVWAIWLVPYATGALSSAIH